MCKNFTRLLGVVWVCGATGIAPGQEPPKEQVIEYRIRQSPQDPASAVTFKIRLYLSSTTWTSSSVDWAVDQVVIERLIGGSGTWSKQAPTTQVWRVGHADVSNPTPAEFVDVPSLSGWALPAEPGGRDLRFDLFGVRYSPPSQMYSGRVSQMDYSFTLADEEEPEEEGEEEPVEVDTPSY